MEIGYIYLIRNINFEYKIGITKKSVNKRVKQLQTGNPHQLEIVSFFFIKNYNKVEKSLHNIYKNKRLNGEWFNLTKEDVSNFEKTVKIFEQAIIDSQENNENLFLL